MSMLSSTLKTWGITLCMFGACHFSNKADAQCGGQWIPTSAFDPVKAGFDDGEVLAIGFWDPDGNGPLPEQIVVGGSFTRLSSGQTANRIATWNGYGWIPLGAGFNGSVLTLTNHNGELFAGGSFTSADGAPANRIAKWNGRSWRALEKEVQVSMPDDKIQTLSSYGGELIAFGTSGVQFGAGFNYVGRYDGSTWRGLRAPFLGIVTGIAAHEGRLYVSERYSPEAAITFKSGLAFWNGNSIFEMPVKYKNSSGGAVQAWGLWKGTEKILGYGSYIGGTWGNYVTLFCALVQTSAPNSGAPAFADAMYGGQSFRPKTMEYFAGKYFAADGSSGPVQYWEESSPGWISYFNPSLNGVSALRQRETTLLLGGKFLGSEQGPSSRFAAWDGSRWSKSMGYGISGTTGFISAMCSYKGETILAGILPKVNGRVCHGIIRWNGAQYLELGTGLDGTISAAAEFGDDLIVCGQFSIPGDPALVNVAAWNGHQWRKLGNELGIVQPAFAIGQFRGDLILGGSFSKEFGSVADFIARWDGTAWRPMENASGQGLSGIPYAFIVMNDKLVAAGQFVSAGGTTVNRVATWDGMKWEKLGNGLSGTGAVVYSLANYNNQLVAGGVFAQSGTTGGIRNLARWNGTSWQVLAGGMNGVVRTLAVSQGNLFAGGSFTSSGSTPLSRVAKWNGTAWNNLNSGTDADVYSMFAEDNGIVIGGYFGNTGGKSSAFWGRWRESTIPEAVAPSASKIVLSGTNVVLEVWPKLGYSEMTSGLSYKWRRNGIDIAIGPAGASPSGGNISGASGNIAFTQGVKCLIDGIRISDAGDYSVKFVNSCGETASTSIPIKVKAHITDINADGQVDDDDFTLFTQQYDFMLCADSNMPDACSADFNHDGLVDDADFSIFAPAYNIMLFE